MSSASVASPAAEPLLVIEHLSVYYDQFRAVDAVDLTVGAGEIVSIIGANGAGKSSLLKAVVGQVGRIAGGIRFDGRNIAAWPTSKIVASGIALVPEGRRLFPTLTVEENLRLGYDVGRRAGMSQDEVYDLFPVLRERRRLPAGQLSGGQQQMVALGRALLADPKIMLCDEISLGLAPTIVNDLYQLLGKINRRGIGIVLVEQDISRSLDVSHRFYCLLEGRVSLTGDPRTTDKETIMKHYFGS